MKSWKLTKEKKRQIKTQAPQKSGVTGCFRRGAVRVPLLTPKVNVENLLCSELKMTHTLIMKTKVDLLRTTLVLITFLVYAIYLRLEDQIS